MQTARPGPGRCLGRRHHTRCCPRLPQRTPQDRVCRHQSCPEWPQTGLQQRAAGNAAVARGRQEVRGHPAPQRSHSWLACAGLSRRASSHRQGHPPAAQGVQETLLAESTREKPGMQAVQVEAPVSRRVSRPLGHRVHLLAAYMEGRKRRLGQGLQLLVAVSLAPVRGSPVTLPAGQTLQTLEPAVGRQAGRQTSRQVERGEAGRGAGVLLGCWSEYLTAAGAGRGSWVPAQWNSACSLPAAGQVRG